MWRKKKCGSLYKTQRNVEATITRPKLCFPLTVQDGAEVTAALQLCFLYPCIQFPVLIYPFLTATPTTSLLEEGAHQPRVKASKPDLLLKSLY